MRPILRRMWGAVRLAAVLAVGVVAGLFLTSCESLRSSHPKGSPASKPPSTQPAAQPTTQPATRSAATKSAVDVGETTKGQPIPRNLLE